MLGIQIVDWCGVGDGAALLLSLYRFSAVYMLSGTTCMRTVHTLLLQVGTSAGLHVQTIT